MDTNTYLSRLKYVGEVRPTLQTLCALQEAHLLSVPFENLDIHAGRRIVLQPGVLFHKIVVMRRGGFCYELNGLFQSLLQELGFQAKLAMGRVYDRGRDLYGPPFDHLLVLVEIAAETWIADVGFGDFAMHPLKFVLSRPLTDKNGQFLIEPYDQEYIKVSRHAPGEDRYVPQYLFSAVERSLADFSEMCLYHQTSPESHFTKQKLCSMATATGRITLTDDKLILTDNGIRTEHRISSQLEFERALARHFNLAL
jgi:N-hydroxyarylamine O-acetyltransferase